MNKFMSMLGEILYTIFMFWLFCGGPLLVFVLLGYTLPIYVVLCYPFLTYIVLRCCYFN